VTYKAKLVHLPGTQLTPGVVLHRTLNKLDRIKAVAVVIQWDDDTFDVDWSQQKTSELVMSAAVYRTVADREMQGGSGK
jgi:hypothetical protein